MDVHVWLVWTPFKLQRSPNRATAFHTRMTSKAQKTSSYSAQKNDGVSQSLVKPGKAFRYCANGGMWAVSSPVNFRKKDGKWRVILDAFNNLDSHLSTPSCRNMERKGWLSDWDNMPKSAGAVESLLATIESLTLGSSTFQIMIV